MWRLLLLIPLLCLGHPSPATSGTTEPRDITVLAQLTGTDSTNLKTEYHRTSHWPEWQAIWASHRTSPSPITAHSMFKFDMQHNMVLAVFQGGCGIHSDVFFHKVEEFPDHIRVRFTVNAVQTALGVRPREHVKPIEFDGGSYGFAVIPKSSKQVRFERGHKSLIAEPYRWDEVAILPAIRQ